MNHNGANRVHVGDSLVDPDGIAHQVVAINQESAVVTLTLQTEQDGNISTVLASTITDGWRKLDAAVRPASKLPEPLLSHLPDAELARVEFLIRHITEVETGMDRSGNPNPRYDPSTHTLAEREHLKIEELAGSERPMALRTLQKHRKDYKELGAAGLVRRKYLSKPGRHSHQSRDTIISIFEELLWENRNKSNRSVETYMQWADDRMPENLAKPSASTMRRYFKEANGSRAASYDAPTRRSNERDGRPYRPAVAGRPGEVVQLDSTTWDVMVTSRFGKTYRPHATYAIDVATRTGVGVLTPGPPKSADVTRLFAKLMLPEANQPGWVEHVNDTHARSTLAQSTTPEERIAAGAARPPIIPETISIDNGKNFTSDTVMQAALSMECSIDQNRVKTPTDKAVVERFFKSVNTQFLERLDGYAGRSVSTRGDKVEDEATLTLAEAQDLLDYFMTATHQTKPHDGLRFQSGQPVGLSPNEAFALLSATAGYIARPVTTHDFLKMLPRDTRVVNNEGIQMFHLKFDSPELRPYKNVHSQLPRHPKKWPIHFDPNDATRVYLYDPYEDRFVTAEWNKRHICDQPFSVDFLSSVRTWMREKGSGDAASGIDIAQVLAKLASDTLPDASKQLQRAKTANDILQNETPFASRAEPRGRPLRGSGRQEPVEQLVPRKKSTKQNRVPDAYTNADISDDEVA